MCSQKRVEDVGASGKKGGANNGETAKKQKTAQERKEKLAVCTSSPQVSKHSVRAEHCVQSH